MASQYQSIWNTLKTNEWAEVTVSKDNARTMIDGVKRVKALENTARRSVGLMGWSKMVIMQTKLSDRYIKVRFELLYSTKL